MTHIYKIFTLSAAALTLSLPAYASTTGSVGGAKVTKGKTAVELRVGYSDDEKTSTQDQRLRTREQIDHGFTDNYAARLIVQQDKRKGNNSEHASITFENRFYVLKAKDYGFDLGVRANYQYNDGDKKPDSIGASLHQEIPLGELYDLRMNQLFSHDVGEDSDDGLGAELRFQLNRKISETHKLGLESFHSFGNLTEQDGYQNQSHQIGPVLKGKIGHGYAYETGYRVGVSDGAPNHNVKFFLSKSF